MPSFMLLMLAVLMLASAPPALAQSAARPPTGVSALPQAPAVAPPAPATLLPPMPQGPVLPPEPPLALPQGMLPLPQGGWRVRFGDESFSIDNAAVQATLTEVGRRLGARTGRVSLMAQASGPLTDASAARRVTLARALAVKQALAAGGLAENRIDVRALGRTAEAEDAVDILPSELQPSRSSR